MISKETEQHLEVLCNALTEVTVKRRLDSKTILIGVQAFLMALAATSQADNQEIGMQLSDMSKYWLQVDCETVENDTVLVN